MRQSTVWLISALLASAFALYGQSSDPLATETKQAYNRIKRNVIAAAELMPEENYGFQPTPEIRNFGQLVAHVADAQTRGCSGINGERKQPSAGSLTAKAELVAALKASFDECDKAYNALTDATATDMLKGRRGERSKIGSLYGNVAHDNEMYGVMGVYLRLKGLVPPSTANRRRR